MLVLSRRLGESIRIGPDVLDYHSNQVRVGITAPKSVHIVREELVGKPVVVKPR